MPRTARKIKPKGTGGPAKAKLKRLASDEIRKQLHLTQEQIDTLDRISSGEYIRNATAILNSIFGRLKYIIPEKHEHTGEVKIVVEYGDE